MVKLSRDYITAKEREPVPYRNFSDDPDKIPSTSPKNIQTEDWKVLMDFKMEKLIAYM